MQLFTVMKQTIQMGKRQIVGRVVEQVVEQTVEKELSKDNNKVEQNS